jgi:hypothetical protein
MAQNLNLPQQRFVAFGYYVGATSGEIAEGR